MKPRKTGTPCSIRSQSADRKSSSLHQLPKLLPDKIHIGVVVLLNGLDVAQQALEGSAEAEFAEVEVRYKVVDVRTERAIQIRSVSVLLREPPGMLGVNDTLLYDWGDLRLEHTAAELVADLDPLTVGDADTSRRLQD